MKQRWLGSALYVGCVGLGCAPMTGSYNPDQFDEPESVRVIHEALDSGATLLDTADIYGPYTNEVLLGKALLGRREQAVLATKGGLVKPLDGSYNSTSDARPASLKRALDASLRRLRTDHVDLYQLHRVDPQVPLEDSWTAMAELVEAGKARAIGLSEVSVDELERAARIYPVATVQSELSLWTRDVQDNGVLAWCAQHEAGFLAYAPLGRGYLTGTVQHSSFQKGDFRAQLPRFGQRAMDENQRILDVIRAVANRVDASMAQIALAWILAQAQAVVPIPGTKRIRWLRENVASAEIELSGADKRLLDEMPTASVPRY
jgi:aryl-alcohol dehydrogenase-like predicted oxidoreductase